MSQLTAYERDTYPAEQFEDKHQQYVSATLGMWTFLATEILFIGALFTGFYAYRLRWADAFAEGAKELKWYLGTINTAVLLVSSYGMAMAVHAAKGGRTRSLYHWLLITFALGAVFIGIKASEYRIEYHEKLVPGLNYSDFSSKGAERPGSLKLFMSFYFVMTGVHALHMLVGLGVLAFIARMAHHGHFSADYHNPVEMVGLYWHFVDLVWVFLFPTLYLLRHP